MLGHADDLGGGPGLAALVRGGERLHHLGGAAQHDAQALVGAKRALDALEHDAGRVVSPHGVDGDGHCVGHFKPPSRNTVGERLRRA